MNVSITDIASTYVLIMWNLPEFANGVIQRYIVLLTDSRRESVLNITTTETSANVTGLNPFTHYGVSVSAETVEIGEASSKVTFRTSEESTVFPLYQLRDTIVIIIIFFQVHFYRLVLNLINQLLLVKTLP